MRIDIRGDGVNLAGHIVDLIERKARLSLGRVSPDVSDVRIVLSDLNGPRKGIDRACVIDVRLRRGGEVHAEGTAEHLMDAVDRALDRASRSARRILARRAAFGRDTIRFTPDARY